MANRIGHGCETFAEEAMPRLVGGNRNLPGLISVSDDPQTVS
jgi:hypothetical protein